MGPVGEPVSIRSYNQFTERFGEDLSYGELAVQMRQFFTAGGSDAVVIRSARNAVPSNLALRTEFGLGPVLTITARDEGILGNMIRTVVDYNTANPELTFNLTVYRETVDTQGRLGREDEEIFSNLSMDPASSNYIENVVNGASALVSIEVETATVLPIPNVNNDAFSQSGIYFDDENAFLTTVYALTDPTIVVEIDGVHQANVNLGLGITTPGDTTATLAGIASRINNALIAQSLSARVNVTLVGNGTDGTSPGTPVALRIAVNSTEGTRMIRILPALSNDATGVLGLGAARGGFETGYYSQFRPAMNGFYTKPFAASGDLSNIHGLLTLVPGAPGVPPYTLDFSDGTTGGSATDIAWGMEGAEGLLDDANPATPQSIANLQANLDSLVAAMNASIGTHWRFSRIGVRIQGFRLDGAVGASNAAGLVNISAPVAAYFGGATANRPSGALGQDGGTPGSDGIAPQLDDYNDIFQTVSRQVEIYNMLILTRGHNQTDDDRSLIWGAASNAARDSNALLIVDPRSDNHAWSNVDEIIADLADFKTGIVPEVSCTFWPRTTTAIGASERNVDPCGTIAGVIAGTIARSGVWRAAAGLSAPLIGATGLEYPMSNADNGVINPRAINALRIKSTGAVCWGARTLAGDDAFSNRDFAYINVRMTTDFIKNSVTRALDGYVFQNNNATTWANIELMGKSFMQGLYEKGAFRGTTADEAYDVQCNEFTTSLADIQLGILNVWVKFAPNFPAEFIHLHIQHKFQQPSA
ncbi:phage tail sheath family protein [Nitrosospira sp. Nl5]|uniref:phage tail sheath family protein n=1 Tax=Nitrosospira sp. Nl5 TaxID=200120 RepID=UPI0015A48100|nr:phage tail sheath family protein [Nitrosospira sp. Nl5]